MQRWRHLNPSEKSLEYNYKSSWLLLKVYAKKKTGEGSLEYNGQKQKKHTFRSQKGESRKRLTPSLRGDFSQVPTHLSLVILNLIAITMKKKMRQKSWPEGAVAIRNRKNEKRICLVLRSLVLETWLGEAPEWRKDRQRHRHTYRKAPVRRVLCTLRRWL